MAFKNRIRLPFKLVKPQFPEDRQTYRKANGQTVTLSVIVRKVYEGITDHMPENLHERLKIALAHDNVSVEGDKYAGVIVAEPGYDIEWPDFKYKPIAQAKFKAEVTPFNATNSNCGTCEEYSQVILQNDDAGTLDEDTEYTINVLENDSICCYPITVTIVSFNADYLSDATVNDQNEVVVNTKQSIPEANGIVILTYRVECDNGMYDEADVIANINGSLPAECLAPTGLSVTSITSSSAQATWLAPTPAPDSYDWELYLATDLVTPIQTGSTIDLYADLTSLSPETEYRIYVNSNCGVTESNSVFTNFTTLPDEVNETCGQYELRNTSSFAAVTQHIDCNGDQQSLIYGSYTVRVVCALQTSPGVPVSINASSKIQITYLGLC